jgi:calcineurin-like phosphoesterase family protein
VRRTFGPIFTWVSYPSHTNIIRYCGRPFKDNPDGVEAMNKQLLRNWRETVKGEDTIINLGDFCFRWSKERIQNTLANLPGKKILVLGNHDRSHGVDWWRDAGFHEVYAYSVIYRENVILSHKPVLTLAPYINIHGHMHEKLMTGDRYINVSVEQLNYRPVKLEGLLERARNANNR